MKYALALVFALLVAGCDAPGGVADDVADVAGVADGVVAGADGDVAVGADGDTSAAAEVEVAAETGGPVVPDVVAVARPELCVNPAELQFGPVVIGLEARISVTVSHCGTDGALAISALSLHAETAPSITLDLTAMGFGELPGLNAPHPPLVLAPGQQASFDVVYRPTVVAQLNALGTPTPDVGLLKVVSNTSPVLWEATIAGFGDTPGWQKPPFHVVEGLEVIPQTNLHLEGAEAEIENGPATRYEWIVHQPVGSKSVFKPDNEAADPTFEANIAGVYTFDLTVWDQDDTPSFFPSFVVVTAVPDAPLHIELLWDTPGDPDETDEGPEVGADLDLHFLHPFAVPPIELGLDSEGWFDQPYDCFWFNAHPNWGSLNVAIVDDPRLDRDDTDGAGPENMNHPLPEDGADYQIGVHYWDDHGFGPSVATIRVYVYAALRYEASVELKPRDLWDVGSIAWPLGQVTPAAAPGGGPRILPDFQSPFFPYP